MGLLQMEVLISVMCDVTNWLIKRTKEYFLFRMYIAPAHNRWWDPWSFFQENPECSQPRVSSYTYYKRLISHILHLLSATWRTYFFTNPYIKRIQMEVLISVIRDVISVICISTPFENPNYFLPLYSQKNGTRQMDLRQMEVLISVICETDL